MNGFSMIVQGIIDCYKQTYIFEDGKTYEAYYLKLKLLDNNNQPNVDYEVRVSEECVNRLNLLDKKNFATTYYVAPIAKLIGEIQYNEFQKKEKKIIHDIELKNTTIESRTMSLSGQAQVLDKDKKK